MINELRSKLPQVDQPIAIVLLLCNIFVSGLGTALCSCIGGKLVQENLVVGAIQFVTAVCFIGWVWSVWWGIELLLKAKTKESNVKEAT